MYINHKKINSEEKDEYVEVKAKAKVPEGKETEETRKNNVFLKGMIERMSNDKYI